MPMRSSSLISTSSRRSMPGGELRVYPGSPLIAKARLRAQDRLIACELEPRAAASLKIALRGDPRAKVLAIDGWMAVNANVPPKERRGLVLIDPPYEDAADFIAAVRRACRGPSQVADRHLHAVVPDQGTRRSGRAGAAAAPAWRAENAALRNHARAGARRMPAWSAPA